MGYPPPQDPYGSGPYSSGPYHQPTGPTYPVPYGQPYGQQYGQPPSQPLPAPPQAQIHMVTTTESGFSGGTAVLHICLWIFIHIPLTLLTCGLWLLIAIPLTASGWLVTKRRPVVIPPPQAPYPYPQPPYGYGPPPGYQQPYGYHQHGQ